MKVKPEHYAILKAAIAFNSEANIKEIKERIDLDIKAGRHVKDYQMRLRWDLLYTSVNSKWICDTLYPYCHDGHIDTALKQIMKEIQS